MSRPNFTLENHGSVWLCRPSSKRALRHLADNVSGEAQWFGDALVVEPRYVLDLRAGLEDNGWTVAR